MKTIFITAISGLTIRNILRTPLFEKLTLNKNLKFVILIPNVREIEPPQHLFQEFESDNVKIEIVENKKIGRAERAFNRFIVSNLVFSKSTRLTLRFHAQEEKRKGIFTFFLYWLLFTPLSKINFLKKVCRQADKMFFYNSQYAKYFDKYKPDLVFSTSIINHFDTDILKEAKRRNIKTVALPRSWDNLAKVLFRVEPDLFLVQNEVMKRHAEKYQAIPSRKIKVVGFPQFDMYHDKSIILSKEDYYRLKNFDPKLPILFLGSEGIWSKCDENIFEQIITDRDKGLISKCNILIRPHFSGATSHNFQRFADYDNVYIDDKFRKSDFFMDNWDQTQEDMIDFASSLFHCNVMITFASTLSLDASQFDKPIIAVRYGIRFFKGKDITADTVYETCHYREVLKTNAVSVVDNRQELMKEINFYLKNPSHKHKERQELVKKLCYKVDGRSSERINEAIQSMLI